MPKGLAKTPRVVFAHDEDVGSRSHVSVDNFTPIDLDQVQYALTNPLDERANTNKTLSGHAGEINTGLGKFMKRLLTGLAAMVVSIGLVFGAVAPAQAATSGAASGSVTLSASDPTLNLVYSNGHATFNVEIFATVVGNSNAKYSIRMYNVSGQQVWSANDQTRRTYYVGSNVTKISITPNARTNGESVQWTRR